VALRQNRGNRGISPITDEISAALQRATFRDARSSRRLTFRGRHGDCLSEGRSVRRIVPPGYAMFEKKSLATLESICAHHHPAIHSDGITQHPRSRMTAGAI